MEREKEERKRDRGAWKGWVLAMIGTLKPMGALRPGGELVRFEYA